MTHSRQRTRVFLSHDDVKDPNDFVVNVHIVYIYHDQVVVGVMMVVVGVVMVVVGVVEVVVGVVTMKDGRVMGMVMISGSPDVDSEW